MASHNGALFVTTVGTGQLYQVDLATRRGTQIGVDDFGSAAETRPVAISSHGAKLYMVGARNDVLYIVDTSTGAATRVGASVSFGVSPAEGDSTGLASAGSALYMTGSGNDWLYTLNTTTGAATRVGTTPTFGASEAAPGGIAGGYLKPAGFSIDSVSGAITYAGPQLASGDRTLYAQISDGKNASNVTDASVDASAPATVTVPVHKPQFGAEQYRFALAPGADGTRIAVTAGTASASDEAGHALTYSLRGTDPPDRMYMMGAGANALYTLDSDNGSARRVGAAPEFGAGITQSAGAHLA